MVALLVPPSPQSIDASYMFGLGSTVPGSLKFATGPIHGVASTALMGGLREPIIFGMDTTSWAAWKS
jgi:hypothetical protein